MRTGGILAVCIALVLTLLTLQWFLVRRDADAQIVTANASAVLVQTHKTEVDVDGVILAARPKLLATLDASQKATENARDLIAQIKRDTMPLVNANLIHSDLVLGNAERAAEHQDEASRKTLAVLDNLDSLTAHADAVVANPAIPRTLDNLDRGTQRGADALDSGAKAMDHLEKKLDQWLNPIRTAGQKVKAGFLEAGRWALRWFTR